MKRPNIESMPRLGRVTVLLSASMALAACASLTAPQRDAYAQAKDQVQQLEAQPLASEAAGMPLQKAREDLANADTAASHNDGAGVTYWSYLASREAQTGQAMVDELTARNSIGSATAERERMLLAYQRRRAERAQQQASSAEQHAAQSDAALQQLQQQNAQQQAQAQIAQAQQQADAARQSEAQARQELEAMQAHQTAEGMMLTLSSSLLFATNRDVLEPGAAPTLASVAQFLQEHSGVKIRLEGFTDSTGSDTTNDALSQRRAQAVGNALEADGVDPSRFLVIGRGSSMPLASNDTSAGRQQNRRVEVLFSDTSGRFASNEAGQALR